jgi:ubiquitin carboxyl-terminal hydrolase 34
LYYRNPLFWDLLGRFFIKFFSRSSIGFNDHRASMETLMEGLLRSFILLLDRLLRVDVTALNEFHPDDIIKEFPLSSKHLRALVILLADRKNLVQSVLALDYRLDAEKLRTSVTQAFAEADGMQHLAQYVRLAVQNLNLDVNLGAKLSPSLQAASMFGTIAFNCGSRSVASFPTQLLEMFRLVDGQLQLGLDKQQDPLSVERRKEIVEALSGIIQAAAKMDGNIAERLFNQIIGHPEPALRDQYGPLIAMVWKVKLMKKYFSKGRMDLRVLGIETMNAELVSFFQANKNPESTEPRSLTIAPVLEFLADILLDEKITDYIVGVESHPQLIQRSQNIVGFLVVTNKFSAEQADLVWKTIISSQDPRVVSATLFMLQNIIKTLTQFKEDVYLCRKLLESPLPAMSQEAQMFFQEFLGVVRGRYQTDHRDSDSNLLPPKLCIRLMSEFSPSRPQAPGVAQLYTEASNTLIHLAPQMSFEERKVLYQSCVKNILQHNVDAAASVRAIQSLVKRCHTDLVYLTEDLQIIPAIMDDFCAFVRYRKTLRLPMDASRLLEELTPRLDLLLDLILMDQNIIQEDRTRVFWDHLVGDDAAGIAAREIAWHRLANFALKSSGSGQNAFLDRCHTDFLPSNKPDHFTRGFFLFVQNITRYKMQAESFSPSNSGDNHIPGLDLVWRVVLTAHHGTGEDAAMEFLAGIYMDKVWLQHMSAEALEAMHASLVDSCLERLKSAHARLRLPKSPDLAEDAMEDAKPQSDRPNHEMVFRRTMQFLSMFLHAIRKQPEFHDPADEAMETVVKKTPPIRGEPIMVKVQFWKGGIQIHSTMEVAAGDLETRKEFHSRLLHLASALGLSSFRILWGGGYLKLMEKPMESLKDMRILSNQLIVREPTHDDRQADIVPPSNRPRTAFEKQIMAQFSEFYALMDSEDAMSKAVSQPRL